MTLRQLWWMARGRLSVSWSQTASVVRSVVLAMTGQEPPLAGFIPAEFVPKVAEKPKLTPEQQAKQDETRRKLAELDHKILTELAAQGKSSRVVRGTRRK